LLRGGAFGALGLAAVTLLGCEDEAQGTDTPTPTPPVPVSGVRLPEMAKVGDLPGGHISDIAFAPSDSQIAYLAVNVNAMGVWRSDDGGESWRRVFYDATHSNTVAVHPTDAQLVLVSDLHGHITRTEDGGKTWRLVYERGAPVWSLAFSASRPAVAYAGTEDGALLRSDDGGRTWFEVSRVPGGAVATLAIDPAEADTVYAGTRVGLYRFTVGGSAWERLIEGDEVLRVSLAASEPGLILAATLDGVFRSDDSGLSWDRTLDQHVHSVEIAPANVSIAYAGTADGVYRSDDGGVTWRRRSEGIAFREVGPLAVDPNDPETVLSGSNIWQWTFHHDPFPASTGGEGVYKTTSGGASWAKKTSVVDLDVIAVAVAANDPNLVYAGTECSSGIFRSDDGAASWLLVRGGPAGREDIAHYTMKLATGSDSSIYMTGRFGFARSEDGGRNWNSLGIPRRHCHGLAISPHDPRIIFVGTSTAQDPTESDELPGGRILRSLDRGLSWDEVGSGFPAGADTSVHDFAFDAQDQARVYVCTASHEFGLPPTATALGVFTSADGGETWVEANGGLTTTEVEALATSPEMSGVVYAGTEDGLFRSDDAGSRWTPTALREPVSSLVIDPRDGNVVFAGTRAGLFWSDDGGGAWTRVDSVPLRPIHSLAIDPSGQALFAAVNGVGVFKGVRA
jgi:photosystem II stability/assembly factor-like uncharacterized protein